MVLMLGAAQDFHPDVHYPASTDSDYDDTGQQGDWGSNVQFWSSDKELDEGAEPSSEGFLVFSSLVPTRRRNTESANSAEKHDVEDEPNGATDSTLVNCTAVKPNQSGIAVNDIKPESSVPSARRDGNVGDGDQHVVRIASLENNKKDFSFPPDGASNVLPLNYKDDSSFVQSENRDFVRENDNKDSFIYDRNDAQQSHNYRTVDESLNDVKDDMPSTWFPLEGQEKEYLSHHIVQRDLMFEFDFAIDDGSGTTPPDVADECEISDDCDTENYERCGDSTSGVKRCVCLGGYEKPSPEDPCTSK